MRHRPLPHWALVCSLAGATALALGSTSLACSASGGSSGTGTTSEASAGSGGAGGAGAVSGSATGTGGDFINQNEGPFTDFPAKAVVEEGLPAELPTLFGGAADGDTGGPCLSEPTLDAMVPKNWTPLFFEWSAPPDQNVFELRLTVDNQINQLVIYTTKTSFTLDAETWTALTSHSLAHDIQVTLRGARLENGALTAGPLTGASGPVHIAPVDAPGSVVYWTSTSGTSFQGFSIGAASPVTVLTPASAGTTSTGGQTLCVSCHTSSPDGKLVIYTRDTPEGTRAVDARRIDGSGPPGPDEISPAALALLGRTKQSAPTMSGAHYSKSDAVAISVFWDPTLTAGRYEIVWTDLHAADGNGWGILPRAGDPRQVSSPTWKHDGTAIAYVSSALPGEGVVAAVTPEDPTMDIYAVPFNNRMGGEATPVQGASDPAYREFYPVYSPGDTLLAFNRTDQPVNSYDQPSAELLVVPSGGGAALRLNANDPPACTGFKSPGVTNSWARWAPKAEEVNGRKYYWLVFSSKRRAASNLLPQLYISSIVTKLEGGVETIEKDYPALYVTSQLPGESNHTPAWDVFEVDDIPPQ